MVTYKYLKRKYLGFCCRGCINGALGMKLQPKDCEYLYYPYVCRDCGERRNIVSDIRPAGRWKLLGAKQALEDGSDDEGAE